MLDADRVGTLLDGARRYSSAADMVEDLRRFRRHEPILASPASTLTRTLRLVRRHRAASLAIVFAVLALVVAPLAFAIHFKAYLLLRGPAERII